MVESLPFFEEKVADWIYKRTFEPTIEIEELKWHQDQEDRLVEVLNENDWFFQFDNTLPQKLSTQIFIPGGVWHRLIKGSTILKVQVTKLPKI